MSKIISHLKENWIKYVFETIVVVTGVFGAFLLNNWNEQNKLKKQAVEVLEELVDEFKINRVEVNKFIAYLDERREPTHSLYSLYALDPADVDMVEFDSLFANTFLYKPLHIGQPVLDEVINSGRLSTISNDSIRMVITQWPGILDRAQSEDFLTYQYVEAVFMYSLDLFAWRNVDEFDSHMQRYQQGKSTLKPDNRNLLQSFEFENRIGQYLWYIDNAQQEYVNLETSMDEIIRLLENDNAP